MINTDFIRNTEYVASGTSYLRFQTSVNADKMDVYKEGFKKVNKKYKFSLLFNSLEEKALGNIISQNFNSSVENLFADSGGLQVVTKGKTISQEEKINIYKHQATNSSLAMCFDEIPVKLLSLEGSSRLDLSTRYFDPDYFKEAATVTGKNIKEQLEVFSKLNSKAKSFLIVQGNDASSYSTWFDLVKKEVPVELFEEYICGISVGAAALGHGEFEDISKMYYSLKISEELLDKKQNRIHLLAAGSYSRLYPALSLFNAGLLNNKMLSYDSTTHTSAIEFGRYICRDGKVNKFSRNYDRSFIVIAKDLIKFDPNYYSSKDPTHLHKCLIVTSIKDEFYKDNDYDICKVKLDVFLLTVMNFIEFVESFDNLPNSYKILSKATSLDDYGYILKKLSKHLKSKPVNTKIRSMF